MAEPETVYVIDDDASVRAAIEDLLLSVGLAVSAFGATRDFLAHLQRNPPEGPACLVLDIRMPGQSGMEFRRQMLEQGLRFPTIFITGHGDIPMSVEAMKTGAIEFLTKPFRDQDLLDAIQQGISLDRQRRAQEGQLLALHSRWSSLSGGEQSVLIGVVRGLLNKQIAAELDVSEITIKVRRSQAMRKMEAGSVAELVRMMEKLSIR
ncbi:MULTISPECIES: response regulator transcription factor [Comamonas]|uniref:response regulator transcription factor n=1 Tax=Comamonas TaxID=283 RepID=UPI0012C99C36|nr:MULTISPECIES: response regulator [Comamonas]MDR3065198.1 response regulator [Comamonas sp.]MEB5963604.1 response regulator [Comamonas testosteroni]MPS92649.1 response regulator transcription factor [Comamonas sp.]